jgi:hypothetical protein
MAIVITIPPENYVSLKEDLDRLAPFDWETRGLIHVFPVKGDPRKVADQLDEYCQNHGLSTILVPKRVHCEEPRLSEAGYKVLNLPSINFLLHGPGLRDQLQELGLDWRSRVLSRLNQYALSTVGNAEIDRWLHQFEFLGTHRTVGEHLLQLLDLVPLPEVGDALTHNVDFFGSDITIGFNFDKWGKSWGTISNLIGKISPGVPLIPITDAIERGGTFRQIRLVEDGLFSGTESRAVLDSLRGTRPAGRSEKVPKLNDPALLSQVRLQIQFGVICDFGERILRKYLASNALNNVQINSSAARTMRVLLKSDGPHLSNEELSQMDDVTFRDELRTRVVPFAFQDRQGWKDEPARDRAQSFCENVGEQLWRAYIEKKQFGSSSWPDDRIKLCALGMEGLGLTVAFPHSVPKATLPVFWATGRVTFNGKSIDWMPLLPNSDG